MTGRLLVRADGGPTIGHGHVMRCLALAQAWRARGGEAVFVGSHDEGLTQALTAAGFPVVPVPRPHPDPADAALTERLLGEEGFTAAVLDGYHFDAGFQSRLRHRTRLLVIDDTAHLDSYDADLLLNQNLGADGLEYRTAGEPLRLLGARYTLLRSEFVERQEREQAFPPRAERLLVTVGGGAQERPLRRILRALEPLGLDVRVAAGARPEEMPELMAWADVALTAAGSTCWELAFMGVPMAATVLAPNQGRNASGLAAAGAAVFLGPLDELADEALAAVLAELVDDVEQRRRLSGAACALVDGQGSARVAAAIAGDAR